MELESITQDYDLSKPVPGHLVVREGLTVYLNENGFSEAEYNAPSVKVKMLGIEFKLPNPPSRQLGVRFHDLHHVVTGYGTDLVGEAEISAWEMKLGMGAFPGLYVKLLVSSIVLFGLFHSPRRTIRAWKAGKEGYKLLKMNMEDYPKLLELSVAELRKLYGVPQQGFAGPRALHENAPKS